MYVYILTMSVVCTEDINVDLDAQIDLVSGGLINHISQLETHCTYIF